MGLRELDLYMQAQRFPPAELDSPVAAPAHLSSNGLGMRFTVPMATKTVTHVELIDDLDGSKADRTVSFAFDGTAYEIELSKKNAAAFEKVLKPYVAAARKARRSPAARTGRGRVAASGENLAAVREWARANGHAVSDRGRIPAAVLEAYRSAR